MSRVLLLTLAAALPLVAALAQVPAAPESDRVSVAELKRLLEEGRPVLILDVRGHADSLIKGARHIPLDQLEARLGELPRGREVVTYCA